MAIDTTQISTDTAVGQIAVLISVIVGAVVALRPVVKDIKEGRKKRSYAVLAGEIESLRRELSFSVQIQRHSSEWEIIARELIRVMRLELVESGIEPNQRVETLMKRIEELDDRDIYSEYIVIGEEEGR